MKNTKLVTTIVGILAAPQAYSANLALLLDAGGISQVALFDTANPGPLMGVPITGVRSGETLVGIDHRANGGGVYVIGAGSTTSSVYTVNTSTGVATLVGSTGLSNTLVGTTYGFDFNPSASGGILARIISDTDDNRVIDSMTGGYFGSVEKVDVFYGLGDSNEGVNPNINHIAYNNNVLGATGTQQFGIDSTLDILTTVANNAGTLATIGELGIDASEFGGFDVDGATGVAYAGFQTSASDSALYTVDLLSGQATLFATLSGSSITGLTSIPEPSPALLLGLGVFGIVGRRKR